MDDWKLDEKIDLVSDCICDIVNLSNWKSFYKECQEMLGLHSVLVTWHVQYNVQELVHPKLWNINLHNVIHSLISRNPRVRMFVVQISLLIVTKFVINAKHQRSQPRTAPCVNMWSVTFSFFLPCLLYVGACVYHIARADQVVWTTLA